MTKIPDDVLPDIERELEFQGVRVGDTGVLVRDGEPIWRSQDGRLTPVSKMATSHLLNALAMLRRKGTKHPIVGVLEQEVDRRQETAAGEFQEWIAGVLRIPKGKETVLAEMEDRFLLLSIRQGQLAGISHPFLDAMKHEAERRGLIAPRSDPAIVITEAEVSEAEITITELELAVESPIALPRFRFRPVKEED